VVDSRKKSDGVWRRRECPACKTRFNTLEVMDAGRPEVRKPKVAKPKVRKQKVVRLPRDKSARRTLEDLRDQVTTDDLGW